MKPQRIQHTFYTYEDTYYILKKFLLSVTTGWCKANKKINYMCEETPGKTKQNKKIKEENETQIF